MSKKMNKNVAKSIAKEIIDLIVEGSDWGWFFYDDSHRIEVATSNKRVVVWLDDDKGLFASVQTIWGERWQGLVSVIDDDGWLNKVWKDVMFNKGEDTIPFFKSVKHLVSVDDKSASLREKIKNL